PSQGLNLSTIHCLNAWSRPHTRFSRPPPCAEPWFAESSAASRRSGPDRELQNPPACPAPVCLFLFLRTRQKLRPSYRPRWPAPSSTSAPDNNFSFHPRSCGSPPRRGRGKALPVRPDNPCRRPASLPPSETQPTHKNVRPVSLPDAIRPSSYL